MPVSSYAPSYFYTKLGELKIEMLAAAARDARVRANSILDYSAFGLCGRKPFTTSPRPAAIMTSMMSVFMSEVLWK